jgi:NADH-quinone oxidoreductase subunit L
MEGYIIFILFASLVSLLLIGFTPKTFGYKAGLFFSFAAAIAGLLLVILFWNSSSSIFTFPWFSIGETQWNFEVVIDSAAIMMIGLISFIGMLVYWFSMTYLSPEEGLKRYFLLLVLFMLSMYGLVLSANLFQIFFFWELVGFCSFGLIGFYYKSINSAKAASKAFMVNRVADLFIVIGLGLIYQQYGTLSITALSTEGSISFAAGLCLLIGASGKSAQYPFAIWLPDAMAGPTPVSAFIHAATMVTAGIILLIRVYFLLPDEVMVYMAFLGAITAAVAAIAALAQHDIKKVLAYSTISQLGYMFAGMGTGAWDASLFHLFTHAFFKAGLFLNAGAVILWLKKVRKQHKIEFDPQDMRVMGGFSRHLPLVFISFTLCSLALIGVPFFSGYLSKDAIISGAYAWSSAKGSAIYYLVPDLAFLTIVLTAIYMIRMWSLIFLGNLKLAHIFPDIVFKADLRSPPVKAAAVILGIMSLGFMVSLNPLDIGQNWVMPGIRNYVAFNPQKFIPEVSTENHLLISGISIAMILIGALYAWRRYRPGGTYHSAYTTYEFRSAYVRTAFYHYYLNNFYQRSTAAFTRSGEIFSRVNDAVFDNFINKFAIVNVVLAHVVKMIDKYIIDGLINFSALFAAFIGRSVKGLASGRIQGQLITAITIFIILLMIIIF